MADEFLEQSDSKSNENTMKFDSKTLIKKFYGFFEEYMSKEIKKAYHEGNPFLEVSFFDISAYDFELGDYLLAYPKDILSIMESTLEQFKEDDSSTKLKIRMTTLPVTERVMVRDIRAEHLGKFVLLEGLVRRKTDVRPRLTHIEYLCTNPSCAYSQEKISMPQIEEKAKTLKACPKCKSAVEVANKVLLDSQNLVLEELSEQLENSSDQPKRINILLQGDLISPFKDSKTNPGSRVLVVGIVTEIPIPTKTGAESVHYDLVVEGNYIELAEEDFSQIVVSKEDKEKIEEIGHSEHALDTLVESTAPSIYGYDKIKEAILLQQFGGTGGTKGDGVKTRGDIHVLLIGDPGAAKSQMLKAATKIAPKSSFVSGKSATGAGLTASVIKDDFTKGWALEAGAMVLASGGLCCIDELDKMSEEDTSAMHEALEQQCYHHDFELQFGDGSTRKIGEYVDGLFENNKSKIIQGVDCEILDINTEEIFTTDFNDNSTIVPQRISRHKPYSQYFEISFSNGRTITVTPKHPLFIYDNDITTIQAKNAKKDMIVPAPRSVKYKGEEQKLTSSNKFHHNNKDISFPDVLDSNLAKLLGYHASEGHSHYSKENRYAEIGFSNTDLTFMEECSDLFKTIFKTTINVNIQEEEKRKKATKRLYTVRCSSIPLYNFFEENFHELLQKAPEKRVPNTIKKSLEKQRISFLQGYYEADGFVDLTRCGYSTSSYSMACDLQDLLLSLDIYSYIATETTINKKYYKVVISGSENIKSFLYDIVGEDDRKTRIQQLLEKSKSKKNDRDIIPYDFLKQFNEFLKKLKISDGYFLNNIKRKQNAHREVVLQYFEKAKEKLQFCGDVAIIEEGKRIEKFLNSKIRFLKIKEVNCITNDNSYNWVYDVTVLPHNTFISQGLILHNSISIAKANIRATLRCETTVLGAANPKLGRFDPYGNIPKQINFPPALLSRFDLLFILRDIPDKKRDDLIAGHILETHKDKSKSVTKLDNYFMKKYIAYARELKPVLTSEAIENIKKFYISIRNATNDEEDGSKSIPITARQLEAIVRLAEAYAKIELSSEVTYAHSQKAIDMMMYCLEKIGVDPKTGEMDIDRITTGVTTKSRSSYWRVLDIIKHLAQENPNVEHKSIIEEAEKQKIDKTDVEKSLEKLKQDSVIMEPRRNIYMVLD